MSVLLGLLPILMIGIISIWTISEYRAQCTVEKEYGLKYCKHLKVKLLSPDDVLPDILECELSLPREEEIYLGYCWRCPQRECGKVIKHVDCETKQKSQ